MPFVIRKFDHKSILIVVGDWAGRIQWDRHATFQRSRYWSGWHRWSEELALLGTIFGSDE